MNPLTSADEFGSSILSSPATGVDTCTDHSLVDATRSGDEAAFAELVNRYRNQIVNYVYRLTNDYEGAVDLAQETFVRVYMARERYHDRYAFSTYIYRIATNLAISELRKRKRRRLVSLTGFWASETDAEPREFDPPAGDVLQDVALVEAERHAAVARAIATLPERYRAPLVLRDVEGQSYDEIARILDTSVGTIKSRISRARGLLREKLRAYL